MFMDSRYLGVFVLTWLMVRGQKVVSEDTIYHQDLVHNTPQCRTVCARQPRCASFIYNVMSRTCSLSSTGVEAVSRSTHVINAGCSDSEVAVRQGANTYTCLPYIMIDCGTPPVFENTTVSVNNTLLGSTCSRMCKEGFDADGNGTSVCLANETWSWVTLVCTEIDCFTPPTRTGTSVTAASHVYGTSVTYVCLDGYDYVSGSGDSTCTSNATWSDVDILCTRKMCGYPEYKDGAIVVYGDLAFESTAVYECIKGFASTGNGTSICLATGHWSSVSLTCIGTKSSSWRLIAKTIQAEMQGEAQTALNTRLETLCWPQVKAKYGDQLIKMSDHGVITAKSWGHATRGFTKTAWNSFSANPLRLFYYFASANDMTEMTVDDTGTVVMNKITASFDWYAEDNECTFIHNVGTSDAVSAVVSGGVLSRYDTVYVYSDNITMVAQYTGHVSQSGFGFQNPPYWFVPKRASDGTSNILRWFLGGLYRLASTNINTEAWCVDTCWHRVLEPSMSTDDRKRNIRHLVSSIEHGHSLMVKAGNIVGTAEDVFVYQGQVTVSLREYWTRADTTSFSSSSRLLWLAASTSGDVTECTHVPESDQVVSIDTDQRDVTWYVDSRIWNKALTVNGTGDVTAGLKSDMVDSLQQGSSLRVGVLLDTGEYRCVEADTVHINAGEVAAEVYHRVKLVMDDNQVYNFTDKCVLIESIITTEGLYTQYTHNIGVSGSHSVVKGVQLIDWFIKT